METLGCAPPELKTDIIIIMTLLLLRSGSARRTPFLAAERRQTEDPGPFPSLRSVSIPRLPRLAVYYYCSRRRAAHTP